MTAFDELMGTAARLNAATEALAALGARTRAEAEGLALPDEVRERLDAICAALGVDLGAVDRDRLAMAASGIRAFFLQAAELLDDPARAPGWTYTEPTVLQSQGRLSTVLADLFATVAPQLDGFEQALGRDGATFCDVGSGVAALSIALCRRWPGLRVVGLEPWEPAMRLATANVAGSGVEDRIELRATGVEEMPDRDLFDVVWLPLPFLPREVVPAALERCTRALRPGGWLVAGLYAGPDDPLATTLVDLRVVRSGGWPWAPGDTEALLASAGCTSVTTLERTWQTPIRFVVGRRPAVG